MTRIECAEVRYIKLGGGNWADVSLDQGELHFGYYGAAHDLGLALDGDAIRKFYLESGRDGRAASEVARQVLDFYGLGADCLWITFARGYLWWTFADAQVHWLGRDEKASRGERIRKSIGGWKNVDIKGHPLSMASLSTKLTRVANYRRTICAVRERDYLLRRINGEEEPIIAAANQAREALIDATAAAIKSLHWADFETLVDIVFSRSGWHRISAVGGRQETIDLELEQPITGERIAVQVKSRSDQRRLDDFIARADKAGSHDRLFFVCHSPAGNLSVGDRPDVHVWSGREFAGTVLRLGLHDWVLEKLA